MFTSRGALQLHRTNHTSAAMRTVSRIAMRQLSTQPLSGPAQPIVSRYPGHVAGLTGGWCAGAARCRAPRPNIHQDPQRCLIIMPRPTASTWAGFEKFFDKGSKAAPKAAEKAGKASKSSNSGGGGGGNSGLPNSGLPNGVSPANVMWLGVGTLAMMSLFGGAVREPTGDQLE